ncbi:MAG: NADH-quinone oxidoreductase subunit L, partial [Halothiobacillus sp.]
SHLHESPKVVTWPLMLLAIPALFIGYFTIDSLLFAGFFGNAIVVLPAHDVMAALQEHFHGAWPMLLHGFTSPVVWLSFAGVGLAALMYLGYPQQLPHFFARVFAWPRRVLEGAYGFDDFNAAVFGGGSRLLGRGLWRIGDVRLIDGLMVNGTAFLIGATALQWRKIQTGYLYHYAFVMILGLIGFMTWIVFLR